MNGKCLGFKVPYNSATVVLLMTVVPVVKGTVLRAGAYILVLPPRTTCKPTNTRKKSPWYVMVLTSKKKKKQQQHTGLSMLLRCQKLSHTSRQTAACASLGSNLARFLSYRSESSKAAEVSSRVTARTLSFAWRSQKTVRRTETLAV